MPTSFQNMATLTYTGGTVNSNIVTGELRGGPDRRENGGAGEIRAGRDGHVCGQPCNSGITPLTGLTISDNLGGYAFGGRPCILWPIYRAAFGTM